jgi:putative transposase
VLVLWDHPSGGDCHLNGVTPETEETLVTDVTISSSHDREPAELSAADEQVLRELTEGARASGMQLTGGAGCWAS